MSTTSNEALIFHNKVLKKKRGGGRVFYWGNDTNRKRKWLNPLEDISQSDQIGNENVGHWFFNKVLVLNLPFGSSSTRNSGQTGDQSAPICDDKRTGTAVPSLTIHSFVHSANTSFSMTSDISGNYKNVFQKAVSKSICSFHSIHKNQRGIFQFVSVQSDFPHPI